MEEGKEKEKREGKEEGKEGKEGGKEEGKGKKRERRKASDVIKIYFCPHCHDRSYAELKNLNGHIRLKHQSCQTLTEKQAIRNFNKRLRKDDMPTISKRKNGALSESRKTVPKDFMLKLLAEKKDQSKWSPQSMMFKIKVDLVTLPNTQQVWRRVTVPSDFTLQLLHPLLQVVFGWQTQHDHRFRDCEGKVIESSQVILGSLLKEPGDLLTYDYQLDEQGWKHRVILEEILHDPPSVPVCLEGFGACPPEDCGGPSGYSNILDFLGGRTCWLEDFFSKDAVLHWILRKTRKLRFDPSEFNVTETNILLKDIFLEEDA